MVGLTDIWNLLAPYSLILVVAIAALVIYWVIAGWAHRTGTTSKRSGVGAWATIVLFFLLGLWLYYTGYPQGGQFVILFAVVVGVAYGVTAGRSSRSGRAPRRSEA